MFVAALKKEFSLVFRDLHAIVVLFLMPAVFIVIMSLAMQDQFAKDGKAILSLAILQEGETNSHDLLQQLSKLSQFDVTPLAKKDRAYAFSQLRQDRVKALIIIPNAPSAPFDMESFQGDSDFDDPPIEIWFSPQLDKASSLLIESAVIEQLVKIEIPKLLKARGIENADSLSDDFIANLVTSQYAYERKGSRATPSSVQQNVPAWLIFSMFFVVIPISTTLVTEKQHGTLVRLCTMNVSMPLFLVAKTLPYLLINQVQLIIMLLIGVYLIPVLGGETLNMGSSYLGLAIMALMTGYAAVGYGLLVAVIVKTTEHATILGGVGNILLGAIGGIMVPKFIMPEYLQVLTNVSPMAWALDGFLDIFLRNGDVAAITGEATALFGFGCLMLLLAMFLFIRQFNPHAVN